jgi:hypothetical protein
VPPRASCLLEDDMNLGSFTRGLPLRIKEITMSSMVRLLPVQPYDTMGSALIDYDVRVQPGVLTEGGSRIVGERSDSCG